MTRLRSLVASLATAALVAPLAVASGTAAVASPVRADDDVITPETSCRLLDQSATPTADLPRSIGSWNSRQVEAAAAVLRAGSDSDSSMRAQTLAVMTAMATTRLGARPVARADLGVVGRPRQSDPVGRPGAFYAALLEVRGWKSLPPSIAVHRAIGNADPTAFQEYWSQAVEVVTGLTSSPLLQHFASTFGTSKDSCRVFLADGKNDAYPLPAGTGYRDLRTFAANRVGSATSHAAQGTTIQAGCGTPVLAAHAGKVRVGPDAGWAGRWLVSVVGRPRGLATSYAHLGTLTVRDGQQVRAGQQLGTVGDLGVAGRCALGFQVRPTGGIGGKPADPTSWLADNAGDGADALRLPASFVIASFNILGDSHSHEHKGFAGGAARAPRAWDFLQRKDVDVAGLQEVQPSQMGVLTRLAGSAWDHFPTSGVDSQDPLFWKTDEFTAVERSTLAIPYFGGKNRNIPVVLLQQKSSGAMAYFINTHNPADIQKSPHNAKWRGVAIGKERALVQKLRSEHPDRAVFLTGDLNDRENAFCPLTEGGVMKSASGGSHDGGCVMPERWIDWIFGTANVTFSGYSKDLSTRGGVSDHPILTATAQF